MQNITVVLLYQYYVFKSYEYGMCFKLLLYLFLPMMIDVT